MRAELALKDRKKMEEIARRDLEDSSDEERFVFTCAHYHSPAMTCLAALSQGFGFAIFFAYPDLRGKF